MPGRIRSFSAGIALPGKSLSQKSRLVVMTKGELKVPGTDSSRFAEYTHDDPDRLTDAVYHDSDTEAFNTDAVRYNNS